MKPHKHAELIKAWADGATIQVKYTDDPQYWIDKDNPAWHPNDQYRIKPETKPDYRRWFVFHKDRPCIYPHSKAELANLVLIFDGETDELKSALVLK
jgi:hypothetical protein